MTVLTAVGLAVRGAGRRGPRPVWLSRRPLAGSADGARPCRATWRAASAAWPPAQGQYNAQTAVANSINANTVMRINQYMFPAQQEANRREYVRNNRRIGKTNATAAETADRLRNRPEPGRHRPGRRAQRPARRPDLARAAAQLGAPARRQRPRRRAWCARSPSATRPRRSPSASTSSPTRTGSPPCCGPRR